jgi:hypothetical protein
MKTVVSETGGGKGIKKSNQRFGLQVPEKERAVPKQYPVGVTQTEDTGVNKKHP